MRWKARVQCVEAAQPNRGEEQRPVIDVRADDLLRFVGAAVALNSPEVGSPACTSEMSVSGIAGAVSAQRCDFDDVVRIDQSHLVRQNVFAVRRMRAFQDLENR
ncbi:hypothetical protein [Methylobacterium sp. Leaf123]|uniref:hypothetical protein n=1 Tax=Methylobacterium sp. Leaf123 TaxID=1736264 RepID=UPI0012E72770|nr:hypothetical protein [Methylobacterium sp. Leaf123]